MRQNAFLLLVAGNATMVNMIALVSSRRVVNSRENYVDNNQGVVTLAQNPSVLSELKSDPSVARDFVEELCRHHTASAKALKRVAKEDAEIGRQTIKAGEGIIASNQSANRDEDVFENADQFNLHRKWPQDRDPLGFGYGEHRCVAEHLAKAELTAVFSTLYQKLPALKITVLIYQIEYTPLHTDVGVQKLPVTF
jgi:nitric oxide reductase